jgi:RNA polymerase sigma-70 factor, ECF subfamily
LAVSVVIVGMEAKMHHSEQTGIDPLAVRLADGDPWAARDLIEQHYAALYRYAFAMLRSKQAAEDAVQDAFERALTALGRYPEERIRAMLLRAWLYRITLNVVRNRLRRNREVAVGGDPDTLLGVPRAGFGERREDIMDVLAVLGRLPERQRVALTLRYLQDLPYAEVCAVTGWPESTAKTLVRRGLARLRNLLVVEDLKSGDRA